MPMTTLLMRRETRIRALAAVREHGADLGQAIGPVAEALNVDGD